MPDIQLSMAVSHYDHVSDLVNGRVHAEGIDLTAMELPIEEIFFRMFSFQEWDVAEFSMAKYVSLVAAGQAPFCAIPVFPSRVFRQSAFYVAAGGPIRRAEDLAGRRIGVPEWVQTAGVYARAFLQHQCGVPLADIHWVQAGVNQAGRTEKVPSSLPNAVKIQQVPDRSLNEMLLAGDLDGIISAREPAAFAAGNPRVVRLWPDYRAAEETYYRETGIFPIMHVIVIKNETLSRHPWAAMNLLRAFDEAKQNSLERLSTIVNSPIAIPWSYSAYRSAQKVFGDDLWPYGIESNRRTLEAFLDYCREQGIIQQRLAIEDMFPAEVSKVFKV
ncbi:MAG: 4,5-dihydroxyphthalate decarboxylase [Acidobacteriota bacterium]|nr:4,5-dihydroxyphthalate decarboxylase [Acidobacteriota bacterium]